MISAEVLKKEFDDPKLLVADPTGVRTQAKPRILLATMDADISYDLNLLLDCQFQLVIARGTEEVKAALRRETFCACFCSFWLVDGTYREVVRLVKNKQLNIPVIVICGASCARESRDYLAALHIPTIDYISHPFAEIDLTRILRSAFPAYAPFAPSVVSPAPPNLFAEVVSAVVG